MNSILDFIGRHVQAIGLVLLAGFLTTASAMYFGLPAFAKKAPAPAPQAGGRAHAH